jgi:large subunit ribosomal protein L25
MIINVAIRVIGEAYGVKTEGGILETATHRLRIRCLPKDLPSVIELDVSALKVGEAIHVGELKVIEGVDYLDDKNQTVVLCVEPPAEEVAAVVTPAAGAAPADGAAAPAAGAAAPAAGAAAPAAGAKPGDAKAAPAAGAKAAAPAAGAKPAAKK